MAIEVTELPGGRLTTKHVTIRRASNPAELREYAAEYAALADHVEGITPTDPEQVAAIEEVVVAASTPEPAPDARSTAARLYHGGLRKVDGA